MRNNETETINIAGNHQFHYLTCKHKTFNVTVAAKFLTHAATTKYKEL